jgi:hypothetical protein
MCSTLGRSAREFLKIATKAKTRLQSFPAIGWAGQFVLGLAMFPGSISSLSVLGAVSGERHDAPALPSPVAGRMAERPGALASVVDEAESVEAEPVEASDVAHRAVETAFERQRILDWADAIRSADGPAAFLIARPDPDGRRPSYPSATEAYRDIAEVIGAL